MVEPNFRLKGTFLAVYIKAENKGKNVTYINLVVLV